MREFNTAGPCNPKLHYTVMREDLIVQGIEKVRKGRYFTLFAPRQSGKTTYFQLLSQALKAENFIPIWITFEDLKSATKEVFYQDLNHQLHHALQKYKITSESQITNQVDLRNLFEGIQHKSIVLIIDEFEGIPAIVLSEVMHAFRRMYHQKEDHALHSLLLIGVSTIAELVTSEASPFNIVEELQVSYFTESEVTHLIKEYVNESGQQFDTQVIKAIYDNTKGQPGLVCGLAAHLLQTVLLRTVTMDDFLVTLDYFLTAKYDNNILNVLRKAKEKKDFMYRLLFGDQTIDFSVDIEDIAYLHANGVIDNIKGVVGIPVPLYSKRIITAFRPIVNGEKSHYGLKVNTSFEEYMQDNGLNMHAILNKYTQYIRKR
ncbi:MAG: AAA-like domain-containing protein, partial [Thiomargarita sp.]|nr:AAA-like domain-containing protein [Thiomargarita sp.]